MVQPRLLVPVVVALLGCNGTSGGGTGDPHVTPNPTVFGSGQKIHNILGPATWFNTMNMSSIACKSAGPTQHLTTGQAVVAVDDFDETGAGATGNVYIEDVPLDGNDPPPYSGVEVFAPSFTPPDHKAYPGDIVDFFGNFTEFLGPQSAGLFQGCRTLPEIEGNITPRFDGTPMAPLTLVQAGTDPKRWDALRGYSNARQWLGMLVRVEQVKLTDGAVCDTKCPNSDCSKCRYSAVLDIGGGIDSNDIFGIDNELFDLKGKGPPITPGRQFTAVTGIVTYFYGFKIAPRSIDDIEQ